MTVSLNNHPSYTKDTEWHVSSAEQQVHAWHVSLGRNSFWPWWIKHHWKSERRNWVNTGNSFSFHIEVLHGLSRCYTLRTRQRKNREGGKKMCQKFTQYIKFVALSVAPEKNEALVRWMRGDAGGKCRLRSGSQVFPLPWKALGFPLDLLILFRKLFPNRFELNNKRYDFLVTAKAFSTARPKNKLREVGPSEPSAAL